MVLTKTTTSIHSWELTLYDEEKDRAWMADTSGVRRVYVGDAKLTGLDMHGNVVEMQCMTGGVITMPYPPPRYFFPKDKGSQVASVESDPLEEAAVESQRQVEQIIVPTQARAEDPKYDDKAELNRRVPVAPAWWGDMEACCVWGPFEAPPLESLPPFVPLFKKRHQVRGCFEKELIEVSSEDKDMD
ncbi:uncharacterized protein LOC130720609 [Lotus japonicus]|uniref:uncharacterized protein LOC130720609 n=1 Tax=Lotus japonicus TaxID=34305 RepID=UPI00258FC565|nr:uncharacterized protein LOC130720609 [Lotus japonicus]